MCVPDSNCSWDHKMWLKHASSASTFYQLREIVARIQAWMDDNGYEEKKLRTKDNF